GRKRHVLTDTIGLLLAVHVHPASVQDRDGAEALLREARRSFPFIARIIGDAGFQGQKMQAAVARTGSWELQIVRRCDRHRFVVLPKRWIVERTLAWISRCRRLARDYERHARKAAAFVRLAMIRLMLRRLASSRRRECAVELVRTSSLHNLKLQSERASRDVHLSYRELVVRIGRVREDGHTEDLGYGLLEQR